jgi:hypothetical protein
MSLFPGGSRVRLSFNATSIHVFWHIMNSHFESEKQQQDAQKDCPARPQREKRRGVRFGTLSL